MLILILLPMLAGALVTLLKKQPRRLKLWMIFAALFVETVLATVLCFLPSGTVTLFTMTEKLQVSLSLDGVGKLFLLVATWGFLLSGVFAFRYLAHAEEGSFPEEMFYAFYCFSLSALVGMDMADNLVAMYFFYEMVTLLSMPLVLHERTKESIHAALKYLFYSIAGAFLALGCIFFLATYSTTLTFHVGGSLDASLVAGHETLLRVVTFLGIIGFGAKAGMYPLHGWLPSAHPVAPAPASAVLSGIIAKAGVLAIIRVLYFSVGTGLVAGTWVQTAWLSIALLTVFMGSMMAYGEKVLKKRLAYSSVSQISYVLTGLFLMNPLAVEGALMQVMYHAAVKICLFLTAGSIIANRGFHRVDELKGLGRTMPVTFATFTLASLSLIGIPPFAGFVSKWYLCEGALDSGLSVFSWLAPVVLLVSALLTAGYLLPISISAFFPGHDNQEPTEKRTLAGEGGLMMLIPLVVLSALALLLGVFSGQVEGLVAPLAASLFAA